MAEINPKKLAAQREAEAQTEWERQRREAYRVLRFNFTPTNLDAWLEEQFERKKSVFIATKSPTWNEVRYEAGVSIWNNIMAVFSSDKRKAIKEKKAVAKEAMQADIDNENAIKRERCDAHNTELTELLQQMRKRFMAHDPKMVENYFEDVLRSDSYTLDGEEFVTDFRSRYYPDEQQLSIDYLLPNMEMVSRIKEWKISKDLELKSKDMNKTDYLEMYETLLFDIAMRVVGIIFESDSEDVLRSIVFNGSCVYSSQQEIPTVLLSFIFKREKYSYSKVKRLDFVSKQEIASLEDARYVDDIHSKKAPAILFETPPIRQVIPIRSSEH